jgi:hypothetical protein
MMQPMAKNSQAAILPQIELRLEIADCMVYPAGGQAACIIGK